MDTDKQIRIPEDAYAALKEYAGENPGMTMRAAMAEAVASLRSGPDFRKIKAPMLSSMALWLQGYSRSVAGLLDRLLDVEELSSALQREAERRKWPDGWWEDFSVIPELQCSKDVGDPGKSPSGLRPRFIAAAERCEEIEEAMSRYRKDGRGIPDDWHRELEDHERWARGRRPMAPEKAGLADA